jgi:hypothetical protein
MAQLRSPFYVLRLTITLTILLLFVSISAVNRMLVALALFIFLLSVACGASATPTPTPAPAAGVVLQQILTDCWGVTQLKDLDGTRPDHVRAFECARTRLLTMAQDYPDAAEPHRLLAWGYLYALDDEAAAQAEYERAAEIYEARNRPQDQSEMLIRLAMLAVPHDLDRGCELLKQATEVDAENVRAPQLLQNFACSTQSATSPISTVTPGAELP